jgi:hypothetical protein
MQFRAPFVLTLKPFVRQKKLKKNPLTVRQKNANMKKMPRAHTPVLALHTRRCPHAHSPGIPDVAEPVLVPLGVDMVLDVGMISTAVTLC